MIYEEVPSKNPYSKHTMCIIIYFANIAIVKVRIDAYKYTTQIRRPKAQKVENIGAWLGILKVITFIAVVLNVRLIISLQNS